MNDSGVELAFAGASGITVLVAYGLLMLGVGVITWLANRGLHQSVDEYYLGGRGLGVMVLFFTFFGVVAAPPLFGVVVSLTGSYGFGFVILSALTGMFGLLLVVGRDR